MPNKLARFLGSNLIIAGAYLSELSSRKIVVVTHLKIGGGSPIYYLPGQEEKLQNFYDELNGKDKASFDLLKEKKVLRDKDLDPLTRVSLRNIKDFAKPLEVNISSGKEIFWKWYLLKNDEAGFFIKELLKPKEAPENKPPAPQEELKKVEEVEAAPVEEIKKEEKIEPKPIENKEETAQIELKPAIREEKGKEKPKIEEKKEPIQEKQKIFEKPQENKKEIQSDFYEKVKNFLALKNIKIVESEALRKTEINLVLKVPTAVGDILYYAKAKSKKKCSDKDVSSAFLEGQMKKLPALFLYSGEMMKKTEEMLQQDIFKNLILLHLD